MSLIEACLSKDVCVLQAANPFFKLLTMLMEFAGGPPGMPPFASYILQRVWEVRLQGHVAVFTCVCLLLSLIFLPFSFY